MKIVVVPDGVSVFEAVRDQKDLASADLVVKALDAGGFLVLKDREERVSETITREEFLEKIGRRVAFEAKMS